MLPENAYLRFSAQPGTGGVMDFRDFLVLARVWSKAGTEGEWRSAASRGYYAAFHVARQLLLDLGFAVPRAERAHAYLWLRLSNSGHPDVVQAGSNLNDLRGERNRADYDGKRAFHAATADRLVQMAEQIIQVLDAARNEPIRTSITDAMKVYERDVLQDVTWHP